MIGSRSGSDVGEALAGLADAVRALGAGGPLAETLAGLIAAAARGTGSEVAVLWLPTPDHGLAARAVWAASAGLAAELEALRVTSADGASSLVRGRLEGGAEGLTVEVDSVHGPGQLELARRGGPFERDEIRVALVAAELAGLAARLVDGAATGPGRNGALDVAGDALAAVTADDGAPARVARLAVVASGGDAALMWRLRDDTLAVAGSYGPVVADDPLRRAAAAIVEQSRMLSVSRDTFAQVVTLQLGQPALGVLQVRFPAGRAPDAHGLEQLSSFAVRAAHAVRSAERAREAGQALERSRALLSVVGEAISQLSLSHTLDTAIERVTHLLGTERVAVYLTEKEELVVAGSRGVEGPHAAIAHALLSAAVQSRQAGVIVEVDDLSTDERFEGVRAHVRESGVGSAIGLGLVVGDDPIGVLAVYPHARRSLSENERALLAALAAQLAVAVENARLHERVTKLNDELTEALASEREKSKRLHAQHEISRTFAQSLSLGTTLDVLASSIVELLGVDAAVIRMPDERGAELVARSVHVNDERVDPAARALLSRTQPLPRHDLLELLRRSEPLILDAALAESFGGALALLAPFLAKGSTAALIPVATPTELLATLTIISLHPGRPVAGEIAETALSIAGQAALAIDNARLYGQQKAFADTMQRSLLPRAKPELPGLELGDVYESAARVEVGGDVYDYLTLGDGRLAVVLGDVTGHGVDATADMAMAKYVFRSLAREHPDPGTFLAAANEIISSEIAPGRFITMVELVLDAAGGEVACASGGHPQPRLVHPDGRVEPISAHGLALGIDAPQEYETVIEPFPPGSIVVVYTDGVIEARRSGEQFGVERLDALLSEHRELAPQAIAAEALAACREWAEGELADDFAIVVVKRAEQPRATAA
jgi:serine phosphatase RsbU (regulator of sigma subunit)/putative methionine-R-sulfoxide reductase with GAF domain